jgi:DNA-binding MarR family transcriptional regulator
MDSKQQPSLGTELRRLIELLDGDVEQRYLTLGLQFRPRFTPVVRAVEALGPSSIRALSQHSGLSHSAVSQTVAQMVKEGMLELTEGADARERIATPTQALAAMMPTLHAQWTATARAAARLDSELSASLLGTVAEAISALEKRAFLQRITDEATEPGETSPLGI